MKGVLADIQDGSFAARFINDQDAGAPEFKAFRETAEKHPIEAVGRELRELMSWVKSHDDDYVDCRAGAARPLKLFSELQAAPRRATARLSSPHR